MRTERNALRLFVTLLCGLAVAVGLLLAFGGLAQPERAAVDVPLEHISSVRVMDIPAAYAAPPTEDSFLWTTGGAGDGADTYTTADWSNIARALSCPDGQGVVVGQLNTLTGTLATNKITMGTGYALVDGKPYYLSAAGDVALASASGGGNSRRYRITLRADWTAQTVRVNVITGTDAASPTTPSYSTTKGSLYDVLLYVVQVDTSGNVTWVDGTPDYCTSSLVDVTTITRVRADGTLTLANDAVDYTKAGAGLPMLVNRVGGSSTNWQVGGTTTYTPTAVLMRTGVMTTNAAGTGYITYPVAYSNVPIPIVTNCDGYPSLVDVEVQAHAATGFTVLSRVSATGAGAPARVCWFAIGPE